MRTLFMLLMFFWPLLFAGLAFANNISVSNVKLQNLDATAGTIEIKFDLSWDNTFNGTDENGQAFFDRAWVFAKFYRADTGVWDHVPLSTGGTVAAYNTTDKTGITADGVGAFLKPGANQTFVWQYTHVPVTMTIANPCVVTYKGHGLPANSPITFSTDGVLPAAMTAGTVYYVHSPTADSFNISTTPGGTRISTSGNTQSGQQRINAPAIMFGDNIQVKVFAIEMVYIPQGAFTVGSGGAEPGAFYTSPTTTSPYTISSENAINVGSTAGYLYYNASYSSYAGDRTGTIPADYPKGYNAFFIMKYEITQGQYRDFLNNLTRTQQNNRIYTQSASYFTLYNSNTVSTYRNGVRNPDFVPASPESITFGCDLNSNGIFNEADDGEWIPCFMSEADGRAYADWAGLRPFTELEYEKAARGGGMMPNANEYAWGTTNIVQATGVANGGTKDEMAIPDSVNAIYGDVAALEDGPLRSGFAATASSGREQAGASYYGVMELSGNLWERPVTCGTSYGRNFTGLHGNGFLDSSGNSNVSGWPASNGFGLRGGTCTDTTISRLCISDRYYGGYNSSSRSSNYGFRAARTE